ncbi:hypothetical protein OF83DRAFT_1179316 [Amylostereum chailletii]|nr:hypothetical protein OF83DRAFT_1179316 [Amylostereum chailletii]
MSYICASSLNSYRSLPSSLDDDADSLPQPSTTTAALVRHPSSLANHLSGPTSTSVPPPHREPALRLLVQVVVPACSRVDTLLSPSPKLDPSPKDIALVSKATETKSPRLGNSTKPTCPLPPLLPPPPPRAGHLHLDNNGAVLFPPPSFPPGPLPSRAQRLRAIGSRRTHAPASSPILSPISAPAARQSAPRLYAREHVAQRASPQLLLGELTLE